MTKYYLDTSIWLDYYENRTDRFRPLGEWALALLSQIRIRSDKILVSDAVLKELEIRYDSTKIREILAPFNNWIELIFTSENQYNESKLIARNRSLPKADALHAILSRDRSSILVSRDHHFEMLQDITKARKPEELI
ncbi:PIN domain protein [uncultured archaeon]|nr:PIN domain protein [uncultured archaeon]